MKKGVLAAGALTLAGGATSGTVTAQEQADIQQALVFSYDFFSQQTFDVVARLEQSTTVNVLQVDEETVPEISQPDNWNGHVIRYQMGEETAGVTTFLFTQDVALDPGDSATFSADASMFSPQLNLLETSTETAVEEEPVDEPEEEPVDEPADEPEEEPVDEPEEEPTDEPEEAVSPCEEDGNFDWCQ